MGKIASLGSTTLTKSRLLEDPKPRSPHRDPSTAYEIPRSVRRLTDIRESDVFRHDGTPVLGLSVLGAWRAGTYFTYQHHPLDFVPDPARKRINFFFCERLSESLPVFVPTHYNLTEGEISFIFPDPYPEYLPHTRLSQRLEPLPRHVWEPSLPERTKAQTFFNEIYHLEPIPPSGPPTRVKDRFGHKGKAIRPRLPVLTNQQYSTWSCPLPQPSILASLRPHYAMVVEPADLPYEDQYAYEDIRLMSTEPVPSEFHSTS